MSKTIHNLHYEQIGKEVRCIEDELPFEIPNSWKWDRWGNISFKIQYGYNASAKNQGKIKMVRISDIQNNMVNWQSVPFCDIGDNEIEDYLLHNNDILFARTGGTVGKSFLVNDIKENAIFAGYLIRTVYDFNNLNANYLKYFMETGLYWNQLKEGTIATAQPNCNGQTLSSMFIPIPPTNEQCRIVDKIKKLEPLIDKYKQAEEQLNDLNSNIKEQLKKSILQYAIEGKLVPQDPNDEPASVLLERIRKEKEKLIGEGKIKKDKNESVIYRRDNSYYEKLGKKEICIDNELPFDIPKNWNWSRLNSIYNFIDYRGKTPSKILKGIPFITAKNIKNGFIDYSIKDYISESDYQIRKSRGISKRNDILFTTEAPLGNVAIANLDKYSAGQRLITFQQYSLNNIFSNELFMYFMLSNHFQQQLINNATGTTVKGIKSEKLKNLLIPFPSTNDQESILNTIRNLTNLLE